MQCKLLFYVLAVVILTASCEGMYDSLESYSGEIVYPAKYDTIVGHIGFERVEIDLMKAGRIPSSQIRLGKAYKTVVEYDDEVMVIDELVSWVNITGLDQSKLYRFRIYTVDEYDNRSVPQEIALIPFTESDMASLAVNSPRVLISPTSAAIDWPNGLSSVLFNYQGLSYSYTDRDGVVREGERGEDSRFFIANLAPGERTMVNVRYKVVPKINSVPILDPIIIEKPLELDVPTSSAPFVPVERDVLEANGVSVFTSDGVSAVEKLVYPLHANSLQDMFYFANLKEVDLTGGDLFEMTTLHYDRNGVQTTTGGGEFPPFVRKVGVISANNAQTLKDMLELGLLERVRYIPNSLGLDALLAPYVESGVVELVELPDEALIPFKFLVDGVIQDGAWRMDIEFPATDAPAGMGLANVMKATVLASSGSFVFSLPLEYQFNADEYRYLKFKVYAPQKSIFADEYGAYQRLWPRFMNHMWAFGNESSFGQEYWAPDVNQFRIADADLQKWIDVAVDLSQMVNRHNRVIVINIGGEPSLTFAPPTDITYYFSNFRFTKE